MNIAEMSWRQQYEARLAAYPELARLLDEINQLNMSSEKEFEAFRKVEEFKIFLMTFPIEVREKMIAHLMENNN